MRPTAEELPEARSAGSSWGLLVGIATLVALVGLSARAAAPVVMSWDQDLAFDYDRESESFEHALDQEVRWTIRDLEREFAAWVDRL